MNHCSDSPIGQTNEVARQCTPKQDENDSSNMAKKSSKYPTADDDLQKIRCSNHSAHQVQEIMDEDEHDDVIKGILYPGLENSRQDYEFFDEEIEMAQGTVGDSTMSQERSHYYQESTSSNRAYHQRSIFVEEEDDSYSASFLSSMRRPYSDVTGEKLRR